MFLDKKWEQKLQPIYVQICFDQRWLSFCIIHQSLYDIDICNTPSKQTKTCVFYIDYIADDLAMPGTNTSAVRVLTCISGNTPHPDSKVHGANMGPTWVLLAPDGPHVGPMNLPIGAVLSGLI